MPVDPSGRGANIQKGTAVVGGSADGTLDAYSLWTLKMPILAPQDVQNVSGWHQTYHISGCVHAPCLFAFKQFGGSGVFSVVHHVQTQSSVRTPSNEALQTRKEESFGT